MSEKAVNDLTLIIPEYPEPADMPQLFANFTLGMPRRLRALESYSVTDDDANILFDFSNATTDGNVFDLYIENGTYWENIEGQKYGFQFAVKTLEKGVVIEAEAGATILPYKEVQPNTLAIITRINSNVWLNTGGGVVPGGPFVLSYSKLGVKDYYG